MYANDPERLQMETARLYKEANFNPSRMPPPPSPPFPSSSVSTAPSVQRRRGGCPHRRLLLDPVPRRAPESIADSSTQAPPHGSPISSSGAPFSGPCAHTIAYLVLPVLLVVSPLREPKDHAARTRARPPIRLSSRRGDSQVFAREDWLLLAQRPRGAHAVLVRQQHPVHRADLVPAEDDQGAGDARGGERRAMPSGCRGSGVGATVRVEYVPKSQRDEQLDLPGSGSFSTRASRWNPCRIRWPANLPISTTGPARSWRDGGELGRDVARTTAEKSSRKKGKKASCARKRKKA